MINEVQYDTAQSGDDSAWEWIELLNTTGGPVSLDGWTVEDNSAADPLPEGLTLPSGGFLVLAASASFYDNFPDYSGPIAFIADGRIGGGLSNTGDRVILRDSTGVVMDAMSYGGDSSQLDPPCPDVAAGHSLERSPAGHDTDQASDFVDQSNPTPGQGVGR